MNKESKSKFNLGCLNIPKINKFIKEVTILCVE